MILTTKTYWTGAQARKTKGMKAIPMPLAINPDVAKLFKLDTAEGYAEIDTTGWLCVGVTGEPWQQKHEKLLKDYDAGTEFSSGWREFMPKPTKIVEFFVVDDDIYTLAGGRPGNPLYIVGLWGETIGGFANLQRVLPGDVVARQLDDRTDQWVVKRAIWDRSYEAI